MKRLLALVFLPISVILAEPPQMGVVQTGITYTVASYAGGMFPANTWIAIQTNNPQTTIVRVTLTFTTGICEGQICTSRVETGNIRPWSSGVSCPSLLGQTGACVAFLGVDWKNVTGMKVEELQVSATHVVQ